MPLITNYRKTRGIIERGVAASRPAAADVLPGTLYYSTDTQVLERSTGSAWEDVSSRDAAGSDTQVQFNDAGVLGGDAGLVYNKTTDVLTVGGEIVLSGAAPLIRTATADGSDSGYLEFNGGGGSGQSRGANFYCIGNESMSGPGSFYFQTGNVAGSTITFTINDSSSPIVLDGATGLITLGKGQLKFPASQNASADANTLDDYEEGSWTPIDSSGAGLSLTVNAARYVKVGSRVDVFADITYPATADGTAAKIGGLPFTSHATMRAGLTPAYNPLATALMYLVGANVTTLTVYTLSGTAVTNINLTGATILFSGTYLAAA